jgi:hypothetical protein
MGGARPPDALLIPFVILSEAKNPERLGKQYLAGFFASLRMTNIF